MKNLIKLPFLYILLLWFIFASPYFIHGLVPYSSKYQVNFFPPWSHYQEFLGPVKNNAMPDVHTQIYPWKKFTIDELKKGQIAYWNPYSFAGNPHLANFQTAVLSPLNLLFFIFPFIDAWSLLVLLQPLLAGIFTYLFLREHKLSSASALLGSISYMFAGFIVVWMAYATLAYAIIYLPLSLFFLERFVKTMKKRYVILFSLTIPLSLFSGHFQTSLYFLLYNAMYLFWIFLREKNAKILVYSIIAFLAGIAFSLPQILPTIEFYAYSVRSEIFNTSGGIPWHYLITTIAPDFYGNPVTRNDWFGAYAEWASFVGIIPLIFTSFALVERKNKNIVFFGFLALGSLFLAVDSFIQPFIGSLHIPVFSTSNPTRIIILYSFSLCVLASFGLDIFLKKSYRKSHVLWVSTLWLFGIVTIWAVLFLGKPFPIDKIEIAKRNLLLPTVLLLITNFLLIANTFFKKNVVLYLSVLIILLGAGFDSFRFAQKWMPFDPKNLVYPHTDVVNAIKQNIGFGRMFGNFGGETAVYYGISSIEGYDPLYIQRYGEFIVSASTGHLGSAERSVVKIDRNGKYTNRVLDLLGVNIIFHPIADTNQNWAYPVWKDINRFNLLYKDDKFQLFRNTKALDRAYMYYDFEILSKDKILNRFYSEGFDIRKTVLLEKNPEIKKNAEKQEWSTKVTSYEGNKIEINVTTSADGMLFIADNFYPGWKAWVKRKDSGEFEEVTVYRADYTFRAIPVKKGESVVVFSYSPL